ncbi:MAG: DEAD/DEAH box helicase [Victivallales bacterium]|nr:DEAD/DEAH box helicase [Victivallales bacterium]
MNIELILSPAGNLRIEPVDTATDNEIWNAPENTAKSLAESFSKGNGPGVLALIREELPSGIPASFRYFRKQAREFVTRLCHAQEPENRDLTALFENIRPDASAFGFEALEAPPLRGAEYISADWLLELRTALERCVQDEFSDYSGTFGEWVRKLNPAWKNVGKVSFHLAENKQDKTGDHPFAFIATFIHRLSENDTPKHLPLGAAVKAYANDRNALLTLLKPVQNAGKRSKLIAQLQDTREIFRPQTWSARQAYDFLRDIPAIEESGVIVRIANIWKGTAPSKVKVSVNIDLKKGQKLGINAMLDFSFKTILNDMELSRDELEQLLNSDGGLVRIKGEWVEAEPDKIRELLRQWDEAAQAAEAGFSFVQGLRMLAGANFKDSADMPEIDGEFCSVNASGQLRELLAELDSPSRIALPELPGKLQKTLRPYQFDGVRWLWRMTELGLGGCLADDMGLGKTLQVLTMLSLLKQRGDTAEIPALLVVPASLLQNWRKEAEKFTPELCFGILHPMALNNDDMEKFNSGPQTFLRQFDAVVTTYGMLSRLHPLREITWTAVIVDEAQAIKNPQSKQSRAVRALRSARRLALTGTPVENRVSDLWSVFDFISPGLLGNLTGFKDFVKKLNGEDGNVNYAPLRQLTRPYIMRRLKTDKRIISDLPDKTEMKVYCQLAKAQAVLYQQAVREMARELRELKESDDIQRRGLVFKYLMMFKQICNHPAQFSGSGEYNPESGGKFLRLTEIAEEIGSRQEKMLVFSQFREMTEPLHEHLSRCFRRPGLILHGGTSIKQRQKLVEQFQQESGPPFFVLSLKAAGTGLNLTAANHVVHFDRWWNPAVENQATDRAFRIGQHRNVLAHKFICRGTVEEKIDALIDEKNDLADSLLSEGAEKLLTDMNNEELLKFVELDVKSIL